MTARCVRVVQNRRFFPPRTYLEKDVAPSVLSSGGTLSIELSFSGKSLSGAQSIAIGMLHQQTIGRSITTYGSLRATPKNPMGRARFCSPLASPSTRKEKLALPSWTSHQSKGHVIAPHELPRPTLRGLDAVSVSTLNLDHCFASGGRPRKRSWMRIMIL